MPKIPFNLKSQSASVEALGKVLSKYAPLRLPHWYTRTLNKAPFHYEISRPRYGVAAAYPEENSIAVPRYEPEIKKGKTELGPRGFTRRLGFEPGTVSPSDMGGLVSLHEEAHLTPENNALERAAWSEHIPSVLDAWKASPSQPWMDSPTLENLIVRTDEANPIYKQRRGWEDVDYAMEPQEIHADMRALVEGHKRKSLHAGQGTLFNDDELMQLALNQALGGRQRMMSGVMKRMDW